MYSTKIVNSYGNAPVFGEKAKTATAASCFFAMNLFRWVQLDLEVKHGKDGQKELSCSRRNTTPSLGGLETKRALLEVRDYDRINQQTALTN